MQHGVYGLTPGGQPEATVQKQIVPTDARLPGYPAFLAVIFFVFGAGNFKAVMLVQGLVDLGACLIVADVARRVISARAAQIAFVMAALCPFLANYSAAVLTETLEIFFTAIALDLAAAALDRMFADRSKTPSEAVCGDRTCIWLWAATGAAIAVCILLRPDGGILLAAVLLYFGFLLGKEMAAKDRGGMKSIANLLVAAVIVTIFALAPLAPWTMRNFR